jgi:hypothetical protein
LGPMAALSRRLTAPGSERSCGNPFAPDSPLDRWRGRDSNPRNLAARLCAEAKDGQILVISRIAEAVEAVARLEDLGNLELKGLRRPVAAFNVTDN